MPGPDLDFVLRHSADVTLRSGRRIRIRPVLPEDKDDLAEGFRQLSPESRYRRFFSASTSLSPDALAYLTEIDYHHHFAWAALDLDAPGQPGVGVARYIRLPEDPQAAEIAVAVAEGLHGLGIGTVLLDAVAVTAGQHGITRLVASILADNQPARGLFRRVGASLQWDAEDACLRAEVPVPVRADDIWNSSLYAVLRAAARGTTVNPTET